jgi:hypothetical protein
VAWCKVFTSYTVAGQYRTFTGFPILSEKSEHRKQFKELMTI